MAFTSSPTSVKSFEQNTSYPGQILGDFVKIKRINIEECSFSSSSFELWDQKRGWHLITFINAKWSKPQGLFVSKYYDYLCICVCVYLCNVVCVCPCLCVSLCVFLILIYQIWKLNPFMTVCSCHVTYAFQSESTLYSCLNVKELRLRTKWFWVRVQLQSILLSFKCCYC